MTIELIHSKPCLIFGCGNPLFGDDGFGPMVIEHLENNHYLPDHAACIDAGTAIRDYLFDIALSDSKPNHIIIVDSSEQEGRIPGEIYEIEVDAIGPKKTSDFSLHQFPTTNLLKELREQTDIDIRVLVVQPEYIPSEIQPGISRKIEAAVPRMCRRIIDLISKEAHD